MSSAKKDPLLDKKHQAILKRMLQQPENKTCADCKCPSPRWASTNLGVFLCIACSGIHRKLGTHISKVRSITLDTWTPAQIAHFQGLGNAVSAAHYEATLPPGFHRPAASDSNAIERFIRDKYELQIYTTGAAPQRPQSYSHTPAAPAPQNGGGLGPRPSNYSSPPLQSTSSYGRRFGSPRARVSPKHAAAVSAIVDMGFPQGMAEEAASRNGGDVQRAVDWVLNHKSTRLYSAPSPRHSLHTHTTQHTHIAEPVQDLLDFSSEASVPRKTSPAKHVPNAFGLDSLLGDSLPMNPQPSASTSSKPVARTTANNGVARAPIADTDFADFGAFESALPSAESGVQAPAQPAQPRGTMGSLNATLAGLYAQKPATVAAVGAPALPRQTAAPRMVTLGQNGLQRAVKSPIRRGTPNSSSRSVRQTPSPSPGQAGVGTYKMSTPPPPPVPTQADMFSKSANAPPPPSPLPPTQKPNSTGQSTEPVPPPAPTPVVEEEADPFAFLAKQALSSATSKKKAPTMAMEANRGTPPAATLPAASTTSSLTFEDLMG